MNNGIKVVILVLISAIVVTIIAYIGLEAQAPTNSQSQASQGQTQTYQTPNGNTYTYNSQTGATYTGSQGTVTLPPTSAPTASSGYFNVQFINDDGTTCGNPYQYANESDAENFAKANLDAGTSPCGKPISSANVLDQNGNIVWSS